MNKNHQVDVAPDQCGVTETEVLRYGLERMSLYNEALLLKNQALLLEVSELREKVANYERVPTYEEKLAQEIIAAQA